MGILPVIDVQKSARQSPLSIQAGVIPLYLACGAIILRSLTYSYSNFRDIFPLYTGLILLFSVLFIWVSLRPAQPEGRLHLIYIIQSIIIFCMISLQPHLDYITAFYTLLCYQMALVIHGKSRWVWCGIFCFLILVSLIIWKGWILGLALALIPIVGSITILSYVIVSRELVQAEKQSELFLKELQEKNAQLKIYHSQAEKIAVIEERNRLARELHDSVSQTMFSIVLNTRATQILLDRQPDRVRAQLEKLQKLTQEALSEMRTLIAQLRPEKE
jgi:signal transduction histidine kinase